MTAEIIRKVLADYEYATPPHLRDCGVLADRIVEALSAPSHVRPTTALGEKIAHVLELSNKALPGPWSHKVLRDYKLSPHDNDTPYVYGPDDTKVMCGLWPIHGPKPEDTMEAERQTFATIELVATLRNLIGEHGAEMALLASSATATTEKDAELMRLIELLGIRYSTEQPGSDPAQPYYMCVRAEGYGQATCHGRTPMQAADRALRWFKEQGLPVPGSDLKSRVTTDGTAKP